MNLEISEETKDQIIDLIEKDILYNLRDEFLTKLLYWGESDGKNLNDFFEMVLKRHQNHKQALAWTIMEIFSLMVQHKMVKITCPLWELNEGGHLESGKDIPMELCDEQADYWFFTHKGHGAIQFTIEMEETEIDQK